VTDRDRPPALLHPFSLATRSSSEFVTIVSGSGATVTDSNGRVYVDALASLWYCQAGHGEGRIVEAITAQASKLATFHTFDRFANEPSTALAERMSAIAPLHDARVFLTSGGSEAVESAIKLARVAHFVGGAPEKTLVVSRRPSYHGVTYGAMGATGLPLNQQGFGPMLADVVQVAHDDLDELDALLSSNDGDAGRRLAAIIAEPVIGAGGVLPPARGYLEGLRERCDRHGAFLILDEVITGFGRLGAWWGAEHFGVVPDLITFAKGVTSGYQPVGGVVIGRTVRERIESDPTFLFRHGNTYAGHPTACAAALANLDVLEFDSLCSRAPGIGRVLAAGLQSVVDGDHVLAVRGEGAMWAATLGEGVVGTPVRDAMLEHGVIARPLGTDVMAFCPPLVITDAQIDQCVSAFAAAVREVRGAAA
jgi:adenosylmethionine-8-amino-7-oxononanoate aminotransferase